MRRLKSYDFVAVNTKIKYDEKTFIDRGCNFRLKYVVKVENSMKLNL